MFVKSLICNKLLKTALLGNVNKQPFRNVHQDSFTSGSSKVKCPIESYYHHYLNLPLPSNKVFATYVWIDGSGITMRSKDRILEKAPTDIDKIPKWTFDGSSTGQATTNDSDTLLIPSAIYNDPFRKCPHVIVLCETYRSDGSPTATNHRAKCAQTLSKISDQKPWFGIEQEFTVFDADLWPIGWPKCRGYPTQNKAEFSYCGVGEHVAGRELIESHARACIYAGLDYGGSNAEVMKGSWEYQIGTSEGIKAADDLWMARYLLSRLSEHFGTVISYHPKPMGKHQPGIGCHHNFSVEKMRSEGGIKEIERVCNILCQRHEEFMNNYGLGDGTDNRKRLTGKFETASHDSCKWGVADRGASIRIQRFVAADRKGFLEDRRPAGDCDPYRVCALLADTCIESKQCKC